MSYSWLINSQNSEFDEQEAVRHSAAHSIHKIGEIIGVIVHHYVVILKDLSHAQHHDPQQSVQNGRR